MEPIEVDPQVQGSVTISGRFTRAQLLDAFDQMLKNNKAELVKASNGYKVVSLAPPASAPPAKTASPLGLTCEPMRVGGNVMESKLIYKMEPIYPPLAKQARISGMVIVTATADEQGNIVDVKVLKGHPLLDTAAIDAVRQWRYQPTLLNGEAIPVVFTVTVIFNLAGGPTTIVTLDASGDLKGVDGIPVSIEDLAKTGNAVRIMTDREIRFDVIEEVLKRIRTAISNVQLTSPDYMYQDGRLFYAPNAAIGSDRLQSPVINVDVESLTSMVRASGIPESMTMTNGGRVGVGFLVFVTDAGEIVAVQQLGPLPIPAVQDALRQARVVSPGRLGGQAVPAAVLIMVPVK
jgi:TonB family protein